MIWCAHDWGDVASAAAVISLFWFATFGIWIAFSLPPRRRR